MWLKHAPCTHVNCLGGQPLYEREPRTFYKLPWSLNNFKTERKTIQSKKSFTYLSLYTNSFMAQFFLEAIGNRMISKFSLLKSKVTNVWHVLYAQT